MALGSKKAVSPLIAAVLLIVITVTIGAVVMSLIRVYVTEGDRDITEGKEAIKCGRDVSMELALVNDNYQICNGTAEDNDMAALWFMVENTGTMDILDAQVRIVGSKGIFLNDSVFNGTLKMGGAQVVNMTYDPDSVGEFRQVKIVPRINLPGVTEHAYCSDSGIAISSIPNNCTTYQ
jgi:flagellin-like protein